MDDGLLIEQVKTFPLLYDKSDKNFKNKLMKENAWKTIAVICEDTAEETERRWNVLRNRYGSEKRKIRCIPSGASSYTIWRFYEDMKFLDTHMTARRTKGNYNKERLYEDSDSSLSSSLGSPQPESFNVMSTILGEASGETENHIIIESDNEEELPIMIPVNLEGTFSGTSNTPTTQRIPILKKNLPSVNKTKNKEGALKQIVEGAIDNLKEMLQNSEPQQEDEDDFFAKSIAMSLKQINSKKQKARVKIKILQVIEEATDD